MNKVMKLFVTPEYFEKSQQKIRELNVQLAQIRHDKTAAYTEDTNTWHDNFAYEHLTRMEKQTQKQIADLMADLDNMHVVPAVVPSVTNSVGLYCSVCVVMENEGTGDQITCRYGIVPLGAECIADKIYAYNMPRVYPLMGRSVGDEVTVRVPSGNMHMVIESIEPINLGGKK